MRQDQQPILDAFLRINEEILKLEELCPGPRLVTIEAWIKYLEDKQQLVLTNDIVELPLHMLDEDFDEEEEFEKYSKRTRIENDVESLAKVRQVCMFCSLLFCCAAEPLLSCNNNNSNNL